MHSSKFRVFLFVFLFLFLILLMDYPYLSRMYNDYISGRVINSCMETEDADDCMQRREKAAAFNRYLAGEITLAKARPDLCSNSGSAEVNFVGDTDRDDPLSGELKEDPLPDELQDDPLSDELQGDPSSGISQEGFPSGVSQEGSSSALFQDAEVWEMGAGVLCNDPSGLAGWIQIPALDLQLPLYVGTKDEVLQKGAGILEGSSLPVGGAGTHSCISAHRGLPDQTLFTNLDLLSESDLIYVHTLGRTIVYEVTNEQTVLPSETGPLAILPGKDLLTLITCTPYGINSHRLYIHARRTVPEDGQEDGALTNGLTQRMRRLLFWKMYWWIPASVILLILMVCLVHRYQARFRRY